MINGNMDSNLQSPGGLILTTFTFWIPLIFSFDQQKVKLFAGGSTAPKYFERPRPGL